MRFKPPPVNSNIGWRVEFRPTEVRKNYLVLLLPIDFFVYSYKSQILKMLHW
jgi:hypothetical protein